MLVVIFLFILGTVFLILSIRDFIKSYPEFILAGIIAVLFYILGSMFIGFMGKTAPTKQDVLDGKAYYQETQVITNNDTIKTYDIVWKQKN